MAKSKLSKYNIVYIPIITFSHVTLNDVKIAMSLYCLIGRRRRHDVIDSVSLLAEKMPKNIFMFQVLRLDKIFRSSFDVCECKYKECKLC